MFLAVLIVSIVLMFVELPILDPLLSIAFTLFILVNVVRNLWITLKLFAQSSPAAGLTDKVKQTLLKLNFVSDFHHFHLWSLDGESHVLTVHLSLEERLNIEQQEELKLEIKKQLEEYKLAHTTIEFEWPDEVCRDA
jgi:cobalt-zinc-cadmium efflux system protein